MAKVANKKKKETPLMGQYNLIKKKHPDAILLFRVGDFYETFGQDAITAAKVLGIVQTKRANGSASHIELAGFPYHALETYLPKLVRAGYRVAICEQLEDPKLTKKIVKRGVTELVTPGLAMNDQILDHKSNNFLASVFVQKDIWGLALLELSTGEFLVAEGPGDYIDKLLTNFSPSELIFSKSNQKSFKENFTSKAYTFAQENWIYQLDYAQDQLTELFGTQNLKGFGIHDKELAVVAAGAVVHYLSSTEQKNLRHITKISNIVHDSFLWLDQFTIRNLELLHAQHTDGVALVDVIDNSQTAMGSRMLKRWLNFPLKDLKKIQQRHDIVEQLILDPHLLSSLTGFLKRIGDLERLVGKVSVKKVNPRELLQLASSITACNEVKSALAGHKNGGLKSVAKQLDPLKELFSKIEQSIDKEAPALLNKGGVIQKGVSEELDELRSIASSGKDYLAKLQSDESEKTGITSLKIGFNNVFGYYLEVRNTHKDKVPEAWIRKQTLVSAERYITPELKTYEEKILKAESQISGIEARLYDELVEYVVTFTQRLQQNAKVIAILDCLSSFASTALKNNYRKPVMTDDLSLDIKGARHAVIEKQLPIGEGYIPNDIYLDNDDQQVIIITGPNMSGKSAILRQTALIVIMAQMGAYVPAESATIGLVDKIFTRVGASDNISSGESTFMVEMLETATIMNNLSERSLVLLDEIGRGTSTYDGLSIAWSIVEYLHGQKQDKAKTIFATHYHELNDLAKDLKRVKNFHVSTKEAGDKVVFLRKLKSGGTAHSFGIHVAQMAGMPNAIIERSQMVLKDLEAQKSKKPSKITSSSKDDLQMSIFQLDDPRMAKIREKLEFVDINSLTPVEALLKLDELKKLL